MKLLIVLMLACFSLNACAGTTADGVKQAENSNISDAKIETNAAENVPVKSIANNSETAESQTKQPKTVRDFFNILPQKYFLLEGCEPAKDKNCERARREYVKTFLETEDTMVTGKAAATERKAVCGWHFSNVPTQATSSPSTL
jgi:hypothetical protein